MYMDSVGIAELRQNLSRYLRRVENGEHMLVTDHNKPVAQLGPIPSAEHALDRIITEGRASAPKRRVLPKPLKLSGDAQSISRALNELRDER